MYRLVLFLIWSLLFTGCTYKVQSSNSRLRDIKLALGYKYEEIGNHVAAKTSFLEAWQLDPKNPDTNTGLAYYYAVLNQDPEAEYFFQRAIQYSQHKGSYYFNYGNYLCARGNFVVGKKYLLMAAKDVNYVGNAKAFENASLCNRLSSK